MDDALTLAHPAPSQHAPRRAARGSSSNMKVLIWGLGVLAVLLIGAVASGVIQLGEPDGSVTQRAGDADMDNSWSYYHDRDYTTDQSGAKWDTDLSRSTDPDEAALGDTTRWEYDGAYRYGPYGSDGMRRRSTGAESTDPLYAEPAPLQDVFSAYGGNLDPSGGAPVGIAPSSATNPYFDPFSSSYTNPYANRIRMAYGEGYDRGALLGTG